MNGLLAVGSELSRKGQTNIQIAVRCILAAAVGSAAICTLESSAQQLPPEVPPKTLGRIEVQGFRISRIPLPPPRISLNTGALTSMNPNSIAYFLDGVRQNNFLGSYDTGNNDQPQPGPVTVPNSQPPPLCSGVDDKATSALMNNPVNIIDRSKHAAATEFQSVSNPDLKLTRYKNPMWKGIGVLGQSWVTNLDYKLSFADDQHSCYPAPGKASCNIGNPKLINFYTEEGGVIQMVRKTSVPIWEGEGTAAMYRIQKIDGSQPYAGMYKMTVKGSSVYSPSMVFRTNGFIDHIDQRDGNNLTYTYDGSNRLTRVTHTSGRTIQLFWTSATPGAVTTITAPNGGIYRFDYYYTGTSFASGVTAPILRKVTYPDGRGNIEYVHQMGTSIVHGSPQPYTNVQKILQIKINGVPYTNYTYPSEFNAEVETSSLADGTNLIRYANAPVGVTVTNAYGKKTTYKIENRQITETIGAASTNCQATFKLASYHENGQLQYATDERDNITQYEYDVYGRRTKVIEAAGTPQQRITIWEWDSDPNNLLKTELIKSITVVGLRKTIYTYTPSFASFPNGPSLTASVTYRNLTGIGAANQDRTTTYSYTFHANGMVATATEDGPLAGSADRKVMAYSSKGDLISVENGLGHKRVFSGHNDFGQPTRIVNENGGVVEYDYDVRGRVVAERRFFNDVKSEVKYIYDANGRLDSVVKPYGRSAVYRYDSVGRIVGQYEQMSNGKYEFESYDYDNASNVVTTYRGEIGSIPGPANPMPANPNPPNPPLPPNPPCQPRGGNQCIPQSKPLAGVGAMAAPTGSTVAFKTRTEYDELGRVLAQRANNGQFVRYTYDAAGNIAAIKDALGRQTKFTYDSLNRVASSTDASNNVTTFERNAADQIVKVTDPRNLNTSYLYDGFGNVWRLASPDTKVTNYTYDGAGRLTRTVRANGKQVDYTYDALSRVLSAVAGGQTQAFIYDTCASGKGRVCKVADPSGELTYTYSPEGLRLTQGQKIGTSSVNFGQVYVYDSLGRLTGISYPGGVSVGYGYTLGHLTAMTAKIGSTTHNVATNIQYMPLGPATGWTYGNGLTRNLLYDQNNTVGDRRLTGVKTMNGGSTLQSLLLAYDAGDQVSRIMNYIDTSMSRNYEYDVLGRLLKESAVGSESTNYSTYGYDANGNRNSTGGKSPGVMLPPSPHVIDTASNRLMSISGGNFFYDNSGNTTVNPMSRGATYEYDPFNRLNKVVMEGITTHYIVNALGQRNRKTQGTAATQWGYLYGPSGQLEVEYYWGNGAWTHYLRFPGGEPVAMVRGSQLYMIHADHLGRPEIATNNGKAVVWRASNRSFDRVVALDNIGGLNLGFPGQYLDTESWLWYNNFRSYSPSIGRYIESDPIGLGGGINTYAYVGGNPVSRIDSSGLSSLLFNRPTGTMYIYHGDGTLAGEFSAGNNTTRASRGPWASGSYAFSYYVPHSGAGPNSAFGSNGNNVFRVPGCDGCGVHAGRRDSIDRRGGSGVNYVTEGCIRTTDGATALIRQLTNAGDPLTFLTVSDSLLAAPLIFGESQMSPVPTLSLFP